MKPIKLTMQAFGPYKHKEIVDFTELQDNRLFLVSGNTGAGKTTIFDGIAFALYGHASGEDRKEHKSMRSDFAEDDTYTLVELVFETKDKTYRVSRQLAHVKKGRKTASGENYEFMELLPDGSEVKACEKQKSKEISQKIEEIIGLTYDQFSQIVMLPQGEFRKLLTSSTQNKEEILRKIFKTERYSKVAEQLEHKKKDAEKKRDEAKTIRDTYIDQITGALPERESELFDRLNGEVNIYQIIEGLQAEQQFYVEKQIEDEKAYEQAQANYAAQQQQFATIQQQNERLQTLYQQQQNLQQLQLQKPHYDEIEQQAKRGNIALQIAAIFEALELVNQELQQAQHTYTNLQKQHTEAQQTLKVATEQLQLEQQTEPERKRLEQSIHELQKIEPLYNQRESIRIEIERAELKYKEIINESNECEQQVIEKTKHLNQLTLQEEQLQEELQQLPATLMDKQQVELLLTQLTQYEQLVQQVEQQRQSAMQQQKRLQLAEEAYQQLEQVWVNNQALQLAAHLVEGEPCPVCGSKEHEPRHISSIEQQVSKEELQHKKVAYEAASKAFHAAEGTVLATKAQLQQLQQQLEEKQVDINAKIYYEKKAQELTEQLQQLEQCQITLKNTNQQRKTTNEQLISLQQQQQTLKEREQQEKLFIETKKVELEALQKQIPADYANLQLIQKAIAEQKAHYEQLVNRLTTAQQQFDHSRIEVTKLQEAVDQTAQRSQHLAAKQQQQQVQWAEALAQSPFDDVEEFKAAIRTRQQITDMEKEVLEFMRNLFALEQFVERESQQLQGKEVVDLTDMQLQLEQQKYAAEQAYVVLNATKDCIKTCEKYEEKLTKVAQTIIELEEVANNILNLYNVLRGQNSRKISFERYVQIGFLEQITAAANVRLLKLSNGQFKLVSSERQLSHGRQSGLSLDVHDSYTDQVRDVKTLSGGEKFNASLCLALGMADVIQSYEGNVRIDTMFIDEGFGSLDEESLNRAIDTLIDLQKSGRMIGIISHVSELKAAIPAVLEVIKLKEGYSKTKITLSS